MRGLEDLIACTGQWKGSYQLWLSPGADANVSPSAATVLPVVKGKFVRFDYTWMWEGELQEGSLLIGYEAGSGSVTAVWIDGWHNGNRFMICHGKIRGDAIDVLGSYPAPSGPDWGWRTVIMPGGPDSLHMTMYNITPEAKEALAVDVRYTPVG
jgi:hypothetical protein